MNIVSLVGLTAVKAVRLLGREPWFQLGSYGKPIALVLKMPEDEAELDKLVERIKGKLYRE